MNLKEVHNSVFDLTIIKEFNNDYDFSLRYKGKELDLEEASFDDNHLLVPLKQLPEKFLDFDASLFPDGLEFGIEFEPEVIDNSCAIVKVIRKENIIHLNYFITPFGDDRILTMKYNSFRIFKTIIRLANANGMRAKDNIEGEESHLYGYITYIVPATGNLADHFRKGVKILEKFFQEAYKEMEAL